MPGKDDVAAVAGQRAVLVPAGGVFRHSPGCRFATVAGHLPARHFNRRIQANRRRDNPGRQRLGRNER